ncbi:MAG: phytoene/squalene synthase family protein [Rhodothermales bacterium]
MHHESGAKNPLPHPFCEDTWSRKLKPAAQALWHWHLHLAEAAASRGEGDDPIAFFEEEGVRAEAGEPLQLLPETVATEAYAVCREHNLPRTLLAEQVRAASRFRTPIRFETYAALLDFIQGWAIAHGRLLARLAGLRGSWQVRHVDELAKAFFLTGRLAFFAQDLARDRFFIPMDEMQQAGVSLEQLRAGKVDDALRRLLWKQVVRARDTFAQGQALVNDLEGRQARGFKRWWLGGLEVLNEIERRNYDLWSHPFSVSPFQKTRVRIQALMGRTSFRKG